LDEALKTRGIIGLLVCLNVETQFWFAPHPITISGYAPVRSMLYEWIIIFYQKWGKFTCETPRRGPKKGFPRQVPRSPPQTHHRIQMLYRSPILVGYYCHDITRI